MELFQATRCSCVIPSMHIKSMLVLFFIGLFTALSCTIHLSIFYPFPSFPCFDLRYWPHDNYASPLLPSTTAPSKQFSSLFKCYSIDSILVHPCWVSYNPVRILPQPDFQKDDKSLARKCARFFFHDLLAIVVD